MDGFEGWIMLGTRLRGATDGLYAYVDELYRRDGAHFQAAWFPVFRALKEHGPSTVSGVAIAIGQTHAGVSQLSKKLAVEGYVTSSKAADKRQRILQLTPKGRALWARLVDLWAVLATSLESRLGHAQGHLLDGLDAVAAMVSTDAFATGVIEAAAQRRSDALTISEFVRDDAEAFRLLNEEWLVAEFDIEPIDREYLADPQRKILEPGGAILCARLHGEVVGVCALVPQPGGRDELSKMAVSSACRGLGIGKRLLGAAVERWRAGDSSVLFLESNRKLAPAIGLYEASGFVHVERTGPPSPYARADVYMEYRG